MDKTVKDNLYIFLSHSSQDKEFVRKLEGTLSSLGIATFLDDKDIRIGESIPRRIVEGIDSSSHMIYVVSKNSIQSKWVKEELDIASIKAKEHEGFIILPILIDDIELTREIKHIKYGDFRWWKIPEKYFSAIDELLSALRFEKPSIPQNEFDNYVSSIEILQSTLVSLSRLEEHCNISRSMIYDGIFRMYADNIMRAFAENLWNKGTIADIELLRDTISAFNEQLSPGSDKLKNYCEKIISYLSSFSHNNFLTFKSESWGYQFKYRDKIEAFENFRKDLSKTNTILSSIVTQTLFFVQVHRN